MCVCACTYIYIYNNFDYKHNTNNDNNDDDNRQCLFLAGPGILLQAAPLTAFFRLYFGWSPCASVCLCVYIYIYIYMYTHKPIQLHIRDYTVNDDDTNVTGPPESNVVGGSQKE